jgi:hypothetical protein
MHANLWKYTPENIRKRFEDAERQAPSLINTCTRIEDFPTAVNLLRNEFCPVDPMAAKKLKTKMQHPDGRFKSFHCTCRNQRFSVKETELEEPIWQQRWLAHWLSCEWNKRPRRGHHQAT